ncbi:hypothetical protein B5X24_HaOG207432 [Helicoverpa armigera]|nr:hypothetical protein B5X24_HaOG207432 [Helicoverpa armigera]
MAVGKRPKRPSKSDSKVKSPSATKETKPVNRESISTPKGASITKPSKVEPGATPKVEPETTPKVEPVTTPKVEPDIPVVPTNNTMDSTPKASNTESKKFGAKSSKKAKSESGVICACHPETGGSGEDGKDVGTACCDYLSKGCRRCNVDVKTLASGVAIGILTLCFIKWCWVCWCRRSCRRRRPVQTCGYSGFCAVFMPLIYALL